MWTCASSSPASLSKFTQVGPCLWIFLKLHSVFKTKKEFNDYSSNTESITTHAKYFHGISTYTLKKTSFGLHEIASDWRKFNFKETLSLRI